VVPGSLTADYELARQLVEALSHHLRTPLTVIIGHAGLLAGGEHELQAAALRSLVTVQRAASRLNDVAASICDLFDVACVDPDAVAAIDVTELVAAEVTALRDRASQRGVRFLVDGEPGIVCVADPPRLRRAVGELLDNALTYGPATSIVGVTTTATDTGIQVTISDQGSGIDPAERERLVRPFERGIHPRQPLAGRGMGLALATAIAAAHQGRLTLSESLGGGLRVSLELPAALTRPGTIRRDSPS
jgi:signal transduction histidine kinase